MLEKIIEIGWKNGKFPIGKFTPGSNIKIITKNKMRKINPKYLLILIKSYKSIKEIMLSIRCIDKNLPTTFNAKLILAYDFILE